MTDGSHELYETLARYQWWRRRWSRSKPGERLEIRKRLQPADHQPENGGEALDRWLFELAGMPDGGTVLDLGCGFGASLLRWVEWSRGSGIGVSASRVQVQRATAEAARRGLDARCRFLVQDFTTALSTACDVACAIESFGHAPDLVAALTNVHRILLPDGRFVWVEDLTSRLLVDDADVAELASRWSSPPLRDLAAARAALDAAGFAIEAEHDLTDRVALAPVAEIERRRANLSRWRAIVPIASWRRLADAFLGGCALERLYAHGKACYVVFLCKRLARAGDE